MLSEADTCRKYVVPRLQAAGWDNEPYSIAEQRTITDGRIVPMGKGFVRKPSKKVDYVLRIRRDFPLAVVEAKAGYKNAADGLQQAKQYAEMLGLKFAYATNGREIIEFDYFTGKDTRRQDYPTPGDLWKRYLAGAQISDQQVADRLLSPANYQVNQGERYHQQLAINRAMEATQKAIESENRVRQVKAEAEQNITQAHGQAEATRQKAQGEADAVLIKARSEAKSNEIIRLSVTPSVLQYRMMQQWDGKLPSFNGGGQIPMLTIDATKFAAIDEATREKKLKEMLKEDADAGP